MPNYQFRNLLFICPKDLNFTNRGGERARNIAIKVQFMGEDGHKGKPLEMIINYHVHNKLFSAHTFLNANEKNYFPIFF